MSKLGDLLKVIEGSHVMGKDGLRDYHAAKAATYSMRKRDYMDRFNTIRLVLKNHRVTVNLQGADIRIWRAETRQEHLFVGKGA